MCSRCSHDKGNYDFNSATGTVEAVFPKLFSEANNMHPSPVPVVLQGLTQIEEMLISPILPMMSVYCLPHGQLGYSGHVINFPQDIGTLVTNLPRHPTNLDVVIIRKSSNSGSHKDFKVRRLRILNALQY